jgi:hypothetical protein
LELAVAVDAGRIPEALLASIAFPSQPPRGATTTQLDKDLMVGIRVSRSGSELPDQKKRYRHGIDF